jgi:hypothetical protein
MDLSELQSHKIIVKELGNMEVIPYTRVVEFIKKYEKFDLDKFENAIKDLESSIANLNSEIKDI